MPFWSSRRQNDDKQEEEGDKDTDDSFCTVHRCLGAVRHLKLTTAVATSSHTSFAKLIREGSPKKHNSKVSDHTLPTHITLISNDPNWILVRK